MKLLRAATLVVADPDASAARYGEWLDYELIERGRADEDLAASWGAPASAGARYVVARPASGAEVFLRFVEGPVQAEYRPLRTYGWAAIEICVADVLAVHERMKRSPFEIIGPPRALDGMPAIFPMQVRGPDQEILYLTQIRDDLPAFDLPRAAAMIDKLFILVLACSDLRASMIWFQEELGLTPERELDIVYTMLAKAFDLPLEQKHTITTLKHERDVFFELDQYPAAATPRPATPGALPPGVALATIQHPDFDALKGSWIRPPVRRGGPIYAGGRVATLRAPDQSLIEIVEIT